MWRCGPHVQLTLWCAVVQVILHRNGLGTIVVTVINYHDKLNMDTSVLKLPGHRLDLTPTDTAYCAGLPSGTAIAARPKG